MPHHHYTTEGLVLRGFPKGEGHREILLLTREFGLVRATARSARENRSKLRAGLVDFSYVHATLLRGRESWRIVGAVLVNNFYYDADSKDKKQLLARLTRLLMRLLAGEEKNEALFSLFLSGMIFLAGEKLFSDDIKNLECVLVLRMLHALGYVGEGEKDLAGVILSSEITRAHLSSLAPLRARAIKEINESLAQSHL